MDVLVHGRARFLHAAEEAVDPVAEQVAHVGVAQLGVEQNGMIRSVLPRPYTVKVMPCCRIIWSASRPRRSSSCGGSVERRSKSGW